MMRFVAAVLAVLGFVWGAGLHPAVAQTEPTIATCEAFGSLTQVRRLGSVEFSGGGEGTCFGPVSLSVSGRAETRGLCDESLDVLELGAEITYHGPFPYVEGQIWRADLNTSVGAVPFRITRSSSANQHFAGTIFTHVFLQCEGGTDAARFVWDAPWFLSYLPPI